jgi:hypothetical protein
MLNPDPESNWIVLQILVLGQGGGGPVIELNCCVPLGTTDGGAEFWWWQLLIVFECYGQEGILQVQLHIAV